MDQHDIELLFLRLTELSNPWEKCLEEWKFVSTLLNEDACTVLFERIAEEQAKTLEQIARLELETGASNKQLEALQARNKRMDALMEHIQPIGDHSLRGRIRFNHNFLKDD